MSIKKAFATNFSKSGALTAVINCANCNCKRFRTGQKTRVMATSTLMAAQSPERTNLAPCMIHKEKQYIGQIYIFYVL